MNSCDGNNTPIEAATEEDQTSDINSEPENSEPLVNLVAEVTQWDVLIAISYTVTNHSDQDLVTFDGPLGDEESYLHVEQTENGVRLFKGKFTSTIAALTPPLVRGNIIMSGGVNSSIGSIDFPILVNAPQGGSTGTIELSPDEVEFCVGYAVAADVADTVVGDSLYPQSLDVDRQQLACTTLTR